MQLWLLAGVLSLSAARLSFSQEQRRFDGQALDPVGTWRCLVYGSPSLGDERVLLSFRPDGSALIARNSTNDSPSWSPLSTWNVTDDAIAFTDSRTGRLFRADLRRNSLAGEWRTVNLLGGWWCAAADGELGSDVDILGEPGSPGPASTKRLIPVVTATPTFPIQAIRAAKEGRVVLCFIVDPSGEVFEPEFVELSDELFRAPSLDALMRSRYKAWNARTEGGARPACRSFIYRLDYVF